MRPLALLFALSNLALAADAVPDRRKVADDLRSRVDVDYARLDALYKHWHANPELSLREEQTAARMAAELKAAGCEVTEKVGGYGVVGVMRNGKGPTVLIRADMDALPVVEQTGIPYASKVRTRDREGVDVGVMHACGHDINMTCLVGTARVMAGIKDRWKGTLVFVGQPAEEIGTGARTMIADGLFERFPKPDFAFALHCDARYPHGTVNYRVGELQANVDMVDIVVRGRGGHGAAPHNAVDPVVLAARIVIDLQTIVSREINPLDSAVVTVGSIHGGTKHNIIPNEVRLQLTVRTLKDDVRKHVIEAIKRIANAAAMGARAPEPLVLHNPDAYTPALVNEPELTKSSVAALREAFGAAAVHERPMSMGGEDFARFGRAGIRSFYFFLGTVSPAAYEESQRTGKPLPAVHSDKYFPIPEPTIKTGIPAMCLTVLEVLGK